MTLAITTREHGRWVVIALDGEADFHTETQVSTALNQARTASSWVVVDCGGLTFCDSSFIGSLVRAYQRAQADGGACVVAAAQPHLQRWLQRTGLDQVIHVYGDVTDAVIR